MRFDILRGSIRIIPETEQDRAFIEDTLGLEKTGDSIKLVRYASQGLTNDLNRLETSKV